MFDKIRHFSTFITSEIEQSCRKSKRSGNADEREKWLHPEWEKTCLPKGFSRIWRVSLLLVLLWQISPSFLLFLKVRKSSKSPEIRLIFLVFLLFPPPRASFPDSSSCHLVELSWKRRVGRSSSQTITGRTTNGTKWNNDKQIFFKLLNFLWTIFFLYYNI